MAIHRANASRVVPRCPHFGVCGGCTLQHADEALQIAAKQRALEDALARIGRVRAETLLPAIAGPAWGYRYRARLSVRDVPKKGGVLIGFHERKSSYVADMRECHVVPPKISGLLPALRALVESLSIRTRLPQIELAVGERLTPRALAADIDAERLVHALVLRILEPLSLSDEAKLVAFADAHGVEFWLQPGGPDTVVPFHPPRRHARLHAAGIRHRGALRADRFHAGECGDQPRAGAPGAPVARSAPGERVADFFCGLGNFTLPIARRGAHAIGVEGSKALVARARSERRAQRSRATDDVRRAPTCSP